MSRTDTTSASPPAPAVPAPPAGPADHDGPPAPVATTAGRPIKAAGRRKWYWIGGIVVAIAVIAAAIPWLIQVLTTVSTDDAYVNGHATFVAPRVAGQVIAVYVDDNNRVKKGDELVRLDPESFIVQVNIAQAAVDAARANEAAAEAQVRSIEAQMRSLRYNLEHSIEDVDNQIALLRAKVAALQSAEATYNQAKDDYDRAAPLVKSGAVTAEDLDHRLETMLADRAQVEVAKQEVYQVRVGLGLDPVPPRHWWAVGPDLTEVPPNLDQDFSTVRQAQLSLAQAAAQIGVYGSLTLSPKEMIANFYARDPEHNLDRIYAKLLKNSPQVTVAKTQYDQAVANLAQAKLNLRYTHVVAEIDGVITRRNVNDGDNVIVGQSLMAIRSLTDIWIDANFKETQLGKLRIGQKVNLDVDMYGSRHQFHGLITGFEMGTGSTLALLPAENATGNFVKVVQRLPVRIELTDNDPDKDPLYIGLSVTPYVLVDEPPIGPNAGDRLQPYTRVATDSAAYVSPNGASQPIFPAPSQSTEPTTQPAPAPGAPEKQP